MAEHTAHTLKGSLSNFGPSIPAQLARELEDLAREEDLKTARPLLDKLKASIPPLLEEISRLAA